MVQRMNAAELAKDVPEAESMLQIHHERKVFPWCTIHGFVHLKKVLRMNFLNMDSKSVLQAEIEGRKSHFAAVREHGNRLVEKKHYSSEEIQKMTGQLDHTKLMLNAAWDKRNHLLTQCHDLQVGDVLTFYLTLFFCLFNVSFWIQGQIQKKKFNERGEVSWNSCNHTSRSAALMYERM